MNLQQPGCDTLIFKDRLGNSIMPSDYILYPDGQKNLMFSRVLAVIQWQLGTHKASMLKVISQKYSENACINQNPGYLRHSISAVLVKPGQVDKEVKKLLDAWKDKNEKEL